MSQQAVYPPTLSNAAPNPPPLLSPPSISNANGNFPSDESKTHRGMLINGFNLISIAGTFIAAIQSQVMSTTIGMTHPSRAVQVVNILYLGGLVLDLMAAFLAFLTARWLQVLVEEERALLEEAFDERTAAKIASRGMLPKTNQTANSPTVGGPTTIKHHDNSNFYIKFMAFSLFSSFIILVLGASALLAGIIVFAWALQPKVVASLVSLVFVATLPFLIGVFLIGDEWERRSAVITRLSWIRGNW